MTFIDFQGILGDSEDLRIGVFAGFWGIAVPLGYLLAEGILLPGFAPGIYGYWSALTLGLTIVGIAMALRLWHISGNERKILKFADT